MSPKAIKYLENPNKKSWAKLTSEERKFVQRQAVKAPAKSKAAPVADTKKAASK